MKNRLVSTRRKLPGIILAAVCTLMLPGAATGDDYEDPGGVNSVGTDPETGFGDKRVIGFDIGGSSIDQRDTLEPQMTAYLTMAELPSYGELFVDTAPTFQCEGESE